MWELFQKILAQKLTPNQALILFSMKQKVGLASVEDTDKKTLVDLGLIVKENGTYTMSPEARMFCIRLDNYFIKAKKKTDIQLMGKNFVDKINSYREIFPAKRLPKF